MCSTFSGVAITAVASHGDSVCLLLHADSDSSMGRWIGDVRQWPSVTDEGPFMDGDLNIIQIS